MLLTDADIEEFRAIWREEFGEEITVDQARHEAMLLLEIYAALDEPLPSAQAGQVPPDATTT